MTLAIAARKATAQSPRYAVTAGGVLWRRRAGELCVCLVTSERRFCEIPCGLVHEDERLSDAAVRIVRSATGFLGKPGKQLARAVSDEREISCLFLLQCSDDARFESATPRTDAIWLPLEQAFDLVPTASARIVIRRAATALAAPIDPRLAFEDEVPRAVANGSG